jgi:hypothetical protein
MDQEARWQNMNSNLEEKRDADQVMKHQIGYSFGTQKFANKKTTCKTSSVFNVNGNAKRSMDMGST